MRMTPADNLWTSDYGAILQELVSNDFNGLLNQGAQLARETLCWLRQHCYEPLLGHWPAVTKVVRRRSVTMYHGLTPCHPNLGKKCTVVMISRLTKSTADRY